MAVIVKTPSNSWKAVVRRHGWPTAIKTFKSKRDAQDWAQATETEMVRGVYVRRTGGERMTLREALERYEAEVSPTKRGSTVKNERARFKILREHLGAYSLAALSPDVIARYRDQRLALGRANNTVRLELALLSHLYATAIREWGLGLTYNPVSNIRKPSPGSGRTRRLDPDEERRLLHAVDANTNPMLGWIVRLALLTAMRQGEILSLRRVQVDLPRRVIRLDETKNGERRLVPLSTRAAEICSAAIRHATATGVHTPLLFYGEPGQDGRRRPYVVNKVWATAVRRAGIEDFRFHDLRHEAISRLVEAGLTDQQVAAISGHKSMQMLKRYTHL
ncbi:MAG: site-specific integrase, partial [Ectothiorhodospiraceae bacterium]|nr:site-specific integrase [Ectothiorhodospiraceae bacterium]